MRKIIATALVLLSCATSLTAQESQYATTFTLSERFFADTISVEWTGSRPIVPVTIEGHTYRFLLDTGSAQATVYATSAIPCKADLGGIISPGANGSADTVRAVELPTIRIGRVSISGYVASLSTTRPAGVRYDGILGFDLINKGLSLKIDIRQNRIILTDIKDFFEREKGYQLHYKLKWFAPYVNVSPFMRHVDEALFATGLPQLYVMSLDAFRVHSYRSKQVNAQVESHAKGSLSAASLGHKPTDEVFFLRLNRFKWDDYSFNDVHTITTQGGSCVGATLLNYGCIVVNPRRKTITFQPYNGSDSVTVGNKQFGIAFIKADGKAKVGLIWHESEGYAKGMRRGDTVVSIDGLPIPDYEAFACRTFESGHAYTFGLRDAKGNEKRVTLTR